MNNLNGWWKVLRKFAANFNKILQICLKNCKKISVKRKNIIENWRRISKITNFIKIARGHEENSISCQLQRYKTSGKIGGSFLKFWRDFTIQKHFNELWKIFWKFAASFRKTFKFVENVWKNYENTSIKSVQIFSKTFRK